MNTTAHSWDVATAHHNSHKGDQAAFLRNGGTTLFSEELSLLGPLPGVHVAHLQCNSGQDSLSLARLGAQVTGVDFSREAISFATQLSQDAGIPADFVLQDVLEWMHTTPTRVDVAFSSYGAVGWLKDLQQWAHGVARILKPGGRLVYVEFHPLVWSVGPQFQLSRDDYFLPGPFLEPVEDYVARSGASLLGAENAVPGTNAIPAESWQHTLASIITSLANAGLVVERLEEYPHANGCKVVESLVDSGRKDRRWVFPLGVPRVPLMFGLVCRKPLG